ncbi:putative quinol monooxygenase [Hymenobacter weizhouensis]|uniref:putative quinol monooxygenase n=1 Tax=Hymenobacter sp. YIM 151500-1 TaxID=2987689 RepID=UPI0029D418C4|nr:putative quinol monooxygenase [Hymenobacter sp. YIM 151500-1]
MLIRIVRMTFVPERVAEFLQLFHSSENQIRQMPGCQLLELWQDADQPHVFCTHSKWESAEALNAYRRSELFGRVWPATKALFAAPPLVFSAQQVPPAVRRANITDKELDRDIINLYLPEPDSYFGTEAELRKLYGSDYDEIIRMAQEDDEPSSPPSA